MLRSCSTVLSESAANGSAILSKSSDPPSRAGRSTVITMSFGASSLVSTRAFITTMASSSSMGPYSPMSFGKHMTSIEAFKSSRTKEHMSSPRLVNLRSSDVTTPPTRRTSGGSLGFWSSAISLRSPRVISTRRPSAPSSPRSGWSET